MTGEHSLDQQTSATAMATAFMRALAAHDPREKARGNDTLAEIFLAEEQKKPLENVAVRAWVMQNKLTPGAYEFMLARTAFFDEIVEQALKDNLAQVVFLGAGYDSRPYRLGKLIQDTVIFELDTAPTQQRKKDCLRQAQVSISGQIRFVTVNFETDDLAGKLTEAGFCREKPTLFVWEGVTYYLGAEAVDHMLAFVKSNTPPGSSICFDYAALSAETLDEHGNKELRKRMRSQFSSEPAKFGIRAGEIEAFLARRGLEVVTHLTAAQMTGKYLSGSETGQVPAMFCFVHARVV